ncbi:probable inactive DNA (cytosine-5)-methyltransferase DRM3 isoform X2 [Impatiens glandulifera]|uniref:probable inactive DNA (cytosine-5)-methyltransferase DRM3 isoform X2 n=1 Tax=Impatiens glandulifera TaxID=253017 RepID=UPI001FB15DBD|nr:probable inactive DNA (cytosine-5)-methyltransferase DRM3 isoform X2 [Impatiens glandulifera]
MISEDMHQRHIRDASASSSGSKLRFSLIDMGFTPSVVDKVIEEKGEDDADLIMETIFSYSKSPVARSDSLDDLLIDNKDEIAVVGHLKEVLHKSNSSDSLDSLFGDHAVLSTSFEVVDVVYPKEEPDVSSGEHVDKRAALLMMNFPLDEVNFALAKLGESAPVSDLMDFIFAAQIDRKHKQAADAQTQNAEGKSKDDNAESLFGTMEKTLRLLEMGFSENQISAAIDKYGVQVPVSELAGYIFEDHHIGEKSEKGKSGNISGSSSYQFPPPFEIKTEDFTTETVPHFRDTNTERYMGKRPKEEYNDDLEALKRPKQEYDDTFHTVANPIYGDKKKHDSISSKSQSLSIRKEPRKKIAKDAALLSKPKSCRSLDQAAAKPPYFFFGSVLDLSQNSWTKISQFLFAIEPELTNTQYFSAMIRQEGYVHNLPTEPRSHILPKPSMTIKEALPHTRKWWPSWDTRKQLSSINPEIDGISQVCEKLGQIVSNSNGIPSVDQQMNIIHQCTSRNLLWVGHNKLGSLDPEHLEAIMGYPINHTQANEFSRIERLQTLKQSFQIDTLGYHLSSLKTLLPNDLVVLSIYSGIGATEIALNRLGFQLKGVVSVEPSEVKRKILNKWWENSGQSGELVQLDDIQKLSTNKLESLVKKFGRFDFVICQNLSNGNPHKNGASDSFGGLDFSLFCEFVRVLQRVRAMIGRTK